MLHLCHSKVGMTKILSIVFFLTTLFTTKSSFAQKDDGYVSMPSPLQIVMIFQNPDLQFDSTLVNSPVKADSYHTKYKRILNYGIYLSDLAYCIQNNENQKAIKYLHALKKIGEKTDVNKYFDKYDLYNRLEKNIDNKDSMMIILIDMSITFEAFLDDKELMKVVGIQFSGIWIEGAYIASQIASFESKESLKVLLVHQYPVLENIVQVMNQYTSENELHAKFKEEMNDLLAAMSKMKTIKKFMKKKNDIPLSDSELKIVEEKLRRIRQKIID